MGENFEHGPELSTFVDAWNSLSAAQSMEAEGELLSKREFLQAVISSALCTQTTSHRGFHMYMV